MSKSLFDPSLLENLDFSEYEDSYKPKISIKYPGPALLLRPLRIADYDYGFTEVLSQLTTVGKVTKEMFEDTFNKLKDNQGMYYVIVFEDLNTNRIVGSGTLLIEQKFIHDCALRGRIEDVVICSTRRGQQLGKLLIHTLSLLSRHLGCYKLSLDCNDSNRGFYESLGFKREEGNSNFMLMRFS